MNRTVRKPKANPVVKQHVQDTLKNKHILKYAALVPAVRGRYPYTNPIQILLAAHELKGEGKEPFSARYGRFVYRLLPHTSYHLVTKRAPIRGKPTLHKLLLQHLVKGKLVNPGPLERWYGINYGAVRYHMDLMERQFNSHGMRFKRPGWGGARDAWELGRGQFTAGEKKLIDKIIRRNLERVAASGGSKVFEIKEVAGKVRQAAERKGFMYPVAGTGKIRYGDGSIRRHTLRLLKEEGKRWRGRINRRQIPSGIVWKALVTKKQRKRK